MHIAIVVFVVLADGNEHTSAKDPRSMELSAQVRTNARRVQLADRQIHVVSYEPSATIASGAQSFRPGISGGIPSFF
jgi:hypothetical protein